MALLLISRVRVNVRDLGLGLGKEGLRVRAGTTRVLFKKGITWILWDYAVTVWSSGGEFDTSASGAGILFKENFCLCENGWK